MAVLRFIAGIFLLLVALGAGGCAFLVAQAPGKATPGTMMTLLALMAIPLAIAYAALRQALGLFDAEASRGPERREMTSAEIDAHLDDVTRRHLSDLERQERRRAARRKPNGDVDP